MVSQNSVAEETVVSPLRLTALVICSVANGVWYMLALVADSAGTDGRRTRTTVIYISSD